MQHEMLFKLCVGTGVYDKCFQRLLLHRVESIGAKLKILDT